MRKARAGSIHEVMQEVVTIGGGVEAVGAEIGVNASTVSRAVAGETEGRPGGIGVIYLHTLSRIVPECAVPIARHFAALAGGIFKPYPKGKSAPVQFHCVAKEFGDLATAYGQAYSEESEDPTTLTDDERVKLLRELEELLEIGALYHAQLKSHQGR